VSLIIRECTIVEIASEKNITEILSEYAAESSIDGLPRPDARLKTYQELEKAKAIRAFGAFFNDMLIGFITVLSPVLPHYGLCVAVTESFFVAGKYRKTGAGLKLLKAAEKLTNQIGAAGLLVSAPIGGNLAEVLPHVGYTETNRVFFRKALNEQYCEY